MFMKTQRIRDASPCGFHGLKARAEDGQKEQLANLLCTDRKQAGVIRWREGWGTLPLLLAFDLRCEWNVPGKSPKLVKFHS